MMDFTTIKKLTIAGVELKQLFINGIQVWKSGYKNWVPLSINSDGTIYNNGLGYKNGYRVRSGGAEGESALTSCTGFMKVSPGDVVRISGVTFDYKANGNAINVSDSNFTNIGQFTNMSGIGPTASTGTCYGIFAANASPSYVAYGSRSVVEETEGVWKWIVPPADSGVAYIRVSAQNETGTYPGENLIVTINEEIT